MKKGKLLLTGIILATTLFNSIAPLGKVVFAEENDNKKMFEIGETEDGKVILSSAKKMKNSRAVGNVQGDVIRVTIGGVTYEGAKITIDGKPAFCIDHNLRAPWEADTPYDNGKPFDNIGVQAIMSRGAYSQFMPNPTDEQILLTEIALNNFLTGKHTQASSVANTNPLVWDLVQKAISGDYVKTEVNFSKTSVKSNIEGNEQVSEIVTLEGSNNQVTINVPVDVTFVNVTTGQKVTNDNVTVKAGEKFQVKAPLNYDKKFNTGQVKPEKGEFIPIMFTPFPVGYQRLVQGLFRDPTPMVALDVDFFARMGKAQVQKIDAETKKPMAGVTFDVTNEQGDSLGKVTTNKDGIGLLDKDFLHDSILVFKEIKTLEGYVLNDAPLKAKIVGGQTVTVSLDNDTQKGRVKGEKQQEVYQKSEAEEKGQSVYDKRPLGGVVLDVTNVTDITRPDGSVVSKAGEISDTVTTDKDGKFTSTKDLYIGSQNKYKLVERDVPENYRPLYDDQAAFSIDYDVENKPKVFTLDLGTLDNDLKTGGFELEKIDSKTGEIIPHTEFLLRGLSDYNKDVLYTIVTGDKVTTDKLIVGKYEIVETKFADGYEQSRGEALTKIFEIKDGETTRLVVKNDKITVETKKPKITIRAKAHIGDGKTNTFTWGENITFYDDVEINHEDILNGTERAFETILVAVYSDGKEKDVWTSGKIDYKVSDKALTQTVKATYDYRKDPEGTRYYFKEIGYNKPSEKEYVPDVDHNKDGKEKDQDITPVSKETPKSLPYTGEQMMKGATIVGLLLLLGVAGAMYLKRKKSSDSSEEKIEETN